MTGFGCNLYVIALQRCAAAVCPLDTVLPVGHRDVKTQNLLLKRHKWALQSPIPFECLPLFAFIAVLAEPIACLRTTTDLLASRAGTVTYQPLKW